MTIQELKNHLEKQEYDGKLLILKYDDNNFIPHQYIDCILKFTHLFPNYIDDLSSLISNMNNIFGIKEDTMLNIMYTDNFDVYDKNICNLINTIIVCNKIGKNCIDLYADYIVEIPKLEEWQIKDYVYSNLNGVPENQLNWLISICKNDIFRLDNEISKLKLFDKTQFHMMFQKFIDDNVFNDLSQYSIFNFSNAIIKRDKNMIIEIYKELNNIDINEIGLVSILYTNFRNIISIQMGKNPTAESLGMKQNQFNAIKYNCGKYNNAELVDIFKTITSVDLAIKNGTLDVNNIIDYVLCKIIKR